jgi:hypothetical protein
LWGSDQADGTEANEGLALSFRPHIQQGAMHMKIKSQRRSYIDFKTRLALHKRLSEVISRPDENGFVTYVLPFSEQKIADEFNIGIATVRRFRAQEFGELIYGQRPGLGGPVACFMRSTNRRLEAIEAALGIQATTQTKQVVQQNGAHDDFHKQGL